MQRNLQHVFKNHQGQNATSNKYSHQTLDIQILREIHDKNHLTETKVMGEILLKKRERNDAKNC